MKSDAAAPGDRLLYNSDFRVFLAGETVSELGSTVGSFALPLGVLIATNSPIASGVVMAAAIGGSTLCSMLAGGWTDGHSRRTIMVTTAMLRFASWTIMGACLLTVGAPLPVFAVLAFVNGVTAALFGAAQAGAVRTIVGGDNYSRAIVTVDGRNNAVDLIGAPLGGAILSVGTAVPFVCNAVSFLASAAAVTRVSADLGAPADATGTPFWSSVRQGYAYVWSRVPYRILILTSAVTNFAVNAFVFALVLDLQRAHRPTWQIGLLTTATAIASLIGATLAGRALERITIATAVRYNILLRVASCAAIAAASSTTVPISAVVALLALGTLLSPMSNAAERSYMALTTPDHYQGRTASFEQFVGTSLIPAAPLVAGTLLASLPTSIALAALTGLLVPGALVLAGSRHITQLPNVHQLTKSPSAAAGSAQHP
ncbi:MFS transporter [Calidifontibacter terrae]